MTMQFSPCIYILFSHVVFSSARAWSFGQMDADKCCFQLIFFCHCNVVESCTDLQCSLFQVFSLTFYEADTEPLYWATGLYFSQGFHFGGTIGVHLWLELYSADNLDLLFSLMSYTQVKLQEYILFSICHKSIQCWISSFRDEHPSVSFLCCHQQHAQPNSQRRGTPSQPLPASLGFHENSMVSMIQEFEMQILSYCYFQLHWNKSGIGVDG